MRLKALFVAAASALPLASAALGGSRSSKCLHSGDEVAINNVLAKGGRGTVVSLCAGSVHRLQNPIVFTAPKQTLTTEGDVKGRERAMLIVQGENQSTAVRADCAECSYATISSIVIDGNRPQMLRIPLGDALIEIGNAEHQTVKDCRLYEPRGWSALHFREGDRLGCQLATVIDNEIGPAGEEWDDEYDGVLEKAPPYGNPRADGISLACKNSLVERNTVFDTTDGAIVIFGSAGSEVKNNEIYSRTRVVLGGINLVDYDPWMGDYTGVRVHHNTLYALSRYFKVGIVIGPSSWSDDTETTVHGATVSDNIFHGDHFGYGIVVSSANDFTVLRNTVDDGAGAKFDGVEGPRCPRAPRNGRPTPFLINRGSARGSYQDDFINGEVQHIICLNPPDEGGKPYKPWRLRDSPAAIADAAAKEAAEHPEKVKLDSSGYDAALAEALVNYQMSLIGAMTSITAKLDAGEPVMPDHEVVAYDDIILADPDSDPEDDTGVIHRRPAGLHIGDEPVAIRGLIARIDKLEKGDRLLKSQLDILSRDIQALDHDLSEHAATNKPIIQYIAHALISLKSFNARGPGIGGVGSGSGGSGGGKSGNAYRDPWANEDDEPVYRAGSKSDSTSGGGSMLAPLGVMVGGGAVVALALALMRQYNRRTSRKGFKAI